MSLYRLLTNVLIAASGPIATILFFAKTDPRNFGSIVVFVMIISAIASIMSTVATFVLNRLIPATLLGVFFAEISYILLMWMWVFFSADGVERAENMMWLPLMSMIVIPSAFPTALTVSYGVGRIVLDWRSFKRRDRTLARNLAKSVVGNEGGANGR